MYNGVQTGLVAIPFAYTRESLALADANSEGRRHWKIVVYSVHAHDDDYNNNMYSFGWRSRREIEIREECDDAASERFSDGNQT